MQDHLWARADVTCLDTSYLSDVLWIIQWRCCSANSDSDSLGASSTPSAARDAAADAPDWSCLCPPDAELLANNTFVLCKDADANAFVAVPPEACNSTTQTLQDFECLATFERLHTEDGFTCDTAASLGQTVTDAVRRYCCTAASTPATSSSDWLSVDQVHCSGLCAARHSQCSGEGMLGTRPCCGPEDICMRRNAYWSQCVTPERYNRKLRQGWDGTVLQCAATP